jgi:membrane protease YdiL (CAAX protease family)
MTGRIPAFILVIGAALFLLHAYLPAGPTSPFLRNIPKETMQVTISLVLLAASLFVILWKGYGPKDKHWAYGTIGTLLGFWLHP